jgi:hypothetical protein
VSWPRALAGPREPAPRPGEAPAVDVTAGWL